MKLSEWLLYGVLGWTAIGVTGIAISLLRRRIAEARRHTAWIAVILAAYLAALLVVSALQPAKSVSLGQDQCFADMCFAVIAAEDVSGHAFDANSRTLRISIRVSNHGHSSRSDPLIRAFLADSRGNIFQPLPGLSGNLLTARVGPDSQIISQPIFHVPTGAAGLGLIFTRGRWQPGRLTIGDPDSIGHKPTVALLGR